MRLKIVLHNSSHTQATYKDIKAFSKGNPSFLGLECLCAHGIASHTYLLDLNFNSGISKGQKIKEEIFYWPQIL